MGIRFVIGRAGTGKTHHCLESIRQRVRCDPINGPNLILLVPEQAALQMERAILEPDDIAGVHRVEVLSFRRLAFRVLDHVSAPTRKALSEPARAMLLGSIVDRLAPTLRYYRHQRRLPGFILQLSNTIAEFIHESITPSELAACAGDGDQLQPAQAAKWTDLAAIYREYLQRIREDQVDPAQYLEIARVYMHQCPFLPNSEVWVDGFASFTGQELQTLVQLAGLCKHMDVTLFAGPSGILAADKAGGPAATELFRKTHQSYARIEKAMCAQGVTVEEPFSLETTTPPRFAQSADLRRLEAGLSGDAGGILEVDSTRDDDVTVKDVTIVELPNRRGEIAYAVARVQRWVQRSENGYRYRDLAIIARDLDLYADLLTEALDAHGIPYFIDRRRSVAHHALPTLLRSAVQIVTEDLSQEATITALKTGLLPLSAYATDLLENAIVASGACGWDRWRQPIELAGAQSSSSQEQAKQTAPEQERCAHLHHAQKGFVDAIEAWYAFATSQSTHSGAEWSRQLAAFFDHLQVWQRLEEWARQAEGDGNLDTAGEHRRMAQMVTELIEDLGEVLGAESLGADELLGVIESGLSVTTLGLAPPMMDQLLIGSIDRSRHPDLKAAVVIGLNDGVFPQTPAEQSILNDDDREFLIARDTAVQPPMRDRIHDESMLVYVAMTRASEKLVISYAASDEVGKPLAASPVLSRITAALPGLRVRRVGDPDRGRFDWDIYSHADLGRRLAVEFRHRPTQQQDDQTQRAYWNALYEQVWRAGNADHPRDFALAGLISPKAAALTSDSVEKLYGGTARLSVSQLEAYAACPFQHFARYTLHLQERSEARLRPLDVGTIHHSILEDCVATLADARKGFSQLDDAELISRLQQSCDRVADRLQPGELGSTARDAYVARRSARQLAKFLRTHRSIVSGGRFRPHAAEVPFGMGDHGLPPLTITTPAGRRIYLRGFIDRVDIAELGDELLGVVIDYKRSADKRLNLSEVYHGLSLQLPAYLLVLAEHGASLAGRPIQPAGALYYALTPSREAVDHPSQSPQPPCIAGNARPRGMLRQTYIAEFDSSLEPSSASTRYAIRLKRDGEPGYLDSSDATPSQAFDSVLEHTKLRMGELADDLIDGVVAVRPFRLGSHSPCGWCAMAGVCGYEMGRNDTNFLNSLKRTEVFQRLEPDA